MRVTICSSSSDLINKQYLECANEVCTFLAAHNYDLNWGDASSSMMGACYHIFAQKNRNIFGYTTKKYKNDIKNMPFAKHKIFDTTFDMKKELFNAADLIVILPGGIGTISEFFSYLEEVRSNDVSKNIILYNYNGHYDLIVKLLDDLVLNCFNDKNICNLIKVVNNIEDFKSMIMMVDAYED